MALLVFGTHDARRAHVAVMRMVATVNGSRPFEGDTAELVRKFAALQGCPRCHGFDKALDFSDILNGSPPWDHPKRAVDLLKQQLKTAKDREEAVHAGLLVAMFGDNQDPEALHVAHAIARDLGVDDDILDGVVRIANDNAASAKADLFRRFLSERIAVDSDLIKNHMERHDLASLSRPELIAHYHQLMAAAPAGSLGAEMRAFYRDASFPVPGMPGSPLPVEFLGSHDVHHVLAGYDISPQGEVYTAVFNAGNTRAGIGWLSVVLLQWHQGVKLGVFDPVHSHLDPAIMARAAERGAQTKINIYDAQWDWMSLLAEPLDEVRRSLSIPPGGLVGPGQKWAT